MPRQPPAASYQSPVAPYQAYQQVPSKEPVSLDPKDFMPVSWAKLTEIWRHANEILFLTVR